MYLTDANTTADGSTAVERWKKSIARALAAFGQTAPAVNRTYPLHMVFTGAAAGTFVGVISVTSSAMRFMIGSGGNLFTGTFIRSTGVIQDMYKYTSTAA